MSSSIIRNYNTSPTPSRIPSYVNIIRHRSIHAIMRHIIRITIRLHIITPYAITVHLWSTSSCIIIIRHQYTLTSFVGYTQQVAKYLVHTQFRNLTSQQIELISMFSMISTNPCTLILCFARWVVAGMWNISTMRTARAVRALCSTWVSKTQLCAKRTYWSALDGG